MSTAGTLLGTNPVLVPGVGLLMKWASEACALVGSLLYYPLTLGDWGETSPPVVQPAFTRKMSFLTSFHLLSYMTEATSGVLMTCPQ